MAEIIAAVDEAGATDVMHDAESQLGTQGDSGSSSLGPFNASYGASVFFSGGVIDLRPPDVIRVQDLHMNYSLNFTFSFDISDIIPDFCLPRVCVNVPCVGRVCTPRICINWPTVTIPVSYSDFVLFTGDFKLDIVLSGGFWDVGVVVVGIPNLQISAAAAAILILIGLSAAAVLLAVPFIGPLLALVVAGVTAAIAIAGVTGLLGPILTPFVSGLRFSVYRQPQNFEVVPASGAIDPAVRVTLDAVAAEVAHNGTEDELVLSIDISP
ncbi:MAG TPA: hypothetical protein VFB78_10090 [Acidimicrobiales bacterium]|nr:hypothetical protein [Acidimicrobiales bacterium]